MALAKCARCGKLYEQVRSAVCPACLPDEDADLAKIRAAIEAYPEFNVSQIAEAAEVTTACVLRLMDEGAVVSADGRTLVKCGRCGAPALSPTHRLCGRCLIELNADMASSVRRIREELDLAKRARGVDLGLDKARAQRIHETLSEKRRSARPEGRKTADWRRDHFEP
ncbi:MAG TPA: hypothetical protein PLO37_00240 [Candidatus Hydrogenedentes bacterium]|nr:hypothetical protein [Candidatus Hydrogenedentota bacterium]HPG65241.1 hypothetical protein [Candidatus Hydrogenedentota bacterium]